MDEIEKEYEEIEREQDDSHDVSDMTDEKLKENPQKGFARGVEAEEYDILPEMKESPEEVDRLLGKDCVDVEYSFTGKEIREGLTAFQKKTVYAKNWIYTGILGLLFILCMVTVLRSPGNALYYFLAVISLATIFYLWYLPKKHIKKTAEAADLAEMRFRLAVYDDCIRITEEKGGFILNYGKELTKVLETKNLFLFCVGKERIFMLPKRFLADAESAAEGLPSPREEQVRDYVRRGMGDKYENLMLEK